MCIYIYIERERCVTHIHIYVYIYIYTYIYIYIHMYCRVCLAGATQRDPTPRNQISEFDNVTLQ